MSDRDEVFHDGLTTFWLIADDQRAANDAVADAAAVEGPFENYITVRLVRGRIEGSDSRFVLDEDGDVECWEVDAQ